MNTSILSNPKPDDGYNAILGALAPHAAPAEGTLGGTTPSVHNRVKQTFINPVATYPFIARKWRNGWEQSFHPGDLMFVYTGRRQDEDKNEKHETSVHTRRHTLLANLPVLNTVMSSTDPTYADMQHVDSWNYIGVMRNSSAASNEQPQKRNHRGGNALVPDRIINIDVRGATRMFNYWAGARAGAHLWLAWREVDMGNAYRKTLDVMAGKPKRNRASYAINSSVSYKDSADGRVSGKVVAVDDATSTYTIEPYLGSEAVHRNADEIDGDGALGEHDSSRCWQLLPYTEGRDTNHRSLNYKPLKVWWSDQSIAHQEYKRPFCAGWVYQGLGKGELSNDSIAIRQATQLCESRFKLPMIHAFLHV
jgi:hypothetical protein